MLVASRVCDSERSLAYGILLVATSCMGIGFGSPCPRSTPWPPRFFPEDGRRRARAECAFGIGTAFAPVFVAIFVGLGIWWGLPVFVRDPARTGTACPNGDESPNEAPHLVPAPASAGRVAAAILDLRCLRPFLRRVETINGNWASRFT